MTTSNKFFLLCFSLMLSSIPAAFAETTEVKKSTEITKVESIRKLNRVLPRMKRRLCNLRVRPEAVVVLIGITATEWNISRLCETKFPLTDL